MKSIIKNNIVKAINKNDPEALSKILKENPNINTNFVYDYEEKWKDYFREDGDNDNKYYKFRTAPLIYASGKGYDRCVGLLLEAGSNPNIIITFRNDIDYFSVYALKEACVRNHVECVRLLLKYGANPNLLSNYEYGESLIRACIFDNVSCAELLLNAGAKVNFVNKSGETAIWFCASFNNVKCLKLLIKWGANPNICPKYIGCPLTQASWYGYLECVQILLNAGANPNVQELSNNDTALITASEKGHVEVIKELFKYKANPFIRNKYRKNALDSAKNKTIRDLLDDYCAKYSIYLVLLYKNKNIRMPDEIYRELNKYLVKAL